jgi:arginine-tRNA-protein transferase
VNKEDNGHTIPCYISAPFDCGYLANHEARNLIIDPKLALSDTLLANLLNMGFRRSGGHIYRPRCEQCQQCISLRLPVNQFRPNRSQRRTWRKNQDLQHSISPAEHKEDQFKLYQDYISYCHPESSMNDSEQEDYLSFLTAPGITTRFHEFRLKGDLLAVAVTDHTPAGLSSVYTFYNPRHPRRSLGTFAILWQIHYAHQLGLPWVYLGYWIKDCAKMRYKSLFKPCDGYFANHWQRLKDQPN